MMEIGGWLQSQNLLQQALHPGRGKQVLSAHDMADALQGIVDDYGEVVAGRDVAARHDNVAPILGTRLDGVRRGQRLIAEFGPCQVPAGTRHGGADVQPPGEGRILGNPPLAFLHRKRLVGRGIKRHTVGIARPVAPALFAIGDEGAYLAAAHEGGIDEFLADQAPEHRSIFCKMLGLAAHGPFPVEAQPFQIGDHARLELWRAARGVDILDAQQQAAATGICELLVEQRRIGVAQMQFAVGAGREAECQERHVSSGNRVVLWFWRLLPCCTSSDKDTMQRIATLDDVERGLDALCLIDPRLGKVRGMAGEVPLRLSEPGFRSLASIIVSQQVSRASADAIFGRLTKLVDPLTPRAILAAGEDMFREAGLSRPKQRGLIAVAQAVADGLDLHHLCSLDAVEAIARMTAVPGIGPWTAEVYLLFAAGHPDIFPARDVALQSAVGQALGIDPRPAEKTLIALAESWSPWRGVASRLFWSYYRETRGRDAAPPA